MNSERLPGEALPLPADLAWADRAGRRCLAIGRAIASGLGDGSAGCRAAAERLAILPLAIANVRPRGQRLQSLPGTFEFNGGVLYFTPRFPFVSRIPYAVVLDGQRVWTIAPQEHASAGTSCVIGIAPSAPVVPLNLLKLYIHFSAPMSDGWALRAVRVCRADSGEPLHDVFLDTPAELWNPDRTRLTLLLDPARIKRGLAPHLESGYPLDEGTVIIVTVSTAFRDAQGQPLHAPASRQYAVGSAIRARVDEAAWRIECPVAGSTGPLVVHFDRPLDHALLGHALTVRNENGAAVVGEATVMPGETAWRFTPALPWGRHSYRLAIDGRLEDLAGNSLERVFDRDLTRPDHTPRDAAHVEVTFTCGAGDPAAAL